MVQFSMVALDKQSEKKISSLCSCVVSFLCQVFLQGGINQEEIPELTAGTGGERC